MLRIYRKLEPNEFIVFGGDCSQGGKDYNAGVFLSKTKLDIPMVYHKRGVAAQMTTDLHPVFEQVQRDTGVIPVVAFETNNGGASEMDRLSVLNRDGKYKLYEMKKYGQVDKDNTDTGKYGFNTNTASRPILLGDLKQCIQSKVLRIPDNEIIKEMMSFIIASNGKPQAEDNAHDDLIFALAIAWQLYQTEEVRKVSSSYYSMMRTHNVVDSELGI